MERPSVAQEKGSRSEGRRNPRKQKFYEVSTAFPQGPKFCSTDGCLGPNKTGEGDWLAGVPALCDACWELRAHGLAPDSISTRRIAALNAAARVMHARERHRDTPKPGFWQSFWQLPPVLLALALSLAAWGFIAWLLVQTGVVR